MQITMFNNVNCGPGTTGQVNIGADSYVIRRQAVVNQDCSVMDIQVCQKILTDSQSAQQVLKNIDFKSIALKEAEALEGFSTWVASLAKKICSSTARSIYI